MLLTDSTCYYDPAELNIIADLSPQQSLPGSFVVLNLFNSIGLLIPDSCATQLVILFPVIIYHYSILSLAILSSNDCSM